MWVWVAFITDVPVRNQQVKDRKDGKQGVKYLVKY